MTPSFPRRPWRTAALATAAAALLAGTAPGSAQAGVGGRQDARLARVDSLLQTGRLPDARRELQTWQDSHPQGAAGVSSHDRAFAFLLQARLATSWPAAEEALVAIALGYPASSLAPEALLRLGQGLLTSERIGASTDGAQRAIGYLQRLIRDYPTSTLRAPALLWLARALASTGNRGAACNALQQATGVASDSLTASLVEEEHRTICPTGLLVSAISMR